MEFGIMVRDDMHGQGIGTEATALAIGWMLDNGCKRVIAGCHEDNIAMRTILERLGGDPYAFAEAHLPNGRREPAVWFEFLDGETDESPLEPGRR